MLPRTATGRLAVVAASTLGALLGAGCGADEPSRAPGRSAVGAAGPHVVTVTADGCANRQPTAVGIVADDERVLTVAHVLRGADAVTVDDEPATIVGVDVAADQALLDVPGLTTVAPAPIGEARPGPVRIVGDRGDLDAAIDDVVDARIGTDDPAVEYDRRVARLDVAVPDGWSGSAVVDDAGALVAVVFATDTDTADLTYAVAAAIPAASDATAIDAVTGRCPR